MKIVHPLSRFYTALIQSKKVHHILGILGLLIIFYFSIIIENNQVPDLTHFDKLKHFIAYFIAAFYYLLITKNKFIVLILLFIYSGLLEIAQSFTLTRSAEILDLLANAIGILSAFIIFKILLKIKM